MWLLDHKPAAATRGEQTLFCGQVGERLHLSPGVALTAQRACVRGHKSLEFNWVVTRWGGGGGKVRNRKESMEKGI